MIAKLSSPGLKPDRCPLSAVVAVAFVRQSVRIGSSRFGAGVVTVP